MATHNKHTFECLRVTGVNSKTVTSTVIETTEADGGRFHPIQVVVAIDAQAGTITAGATVSVGITAATYVDILAATALTGLTAINTTLSIPIPATVRTSIAAGTAVRVNVSVAATGAGTQSFTIYVWGFYA